MSCSWSATNLVGVMHYWRGVKITFRAVDWWTLESDFYRNVGEGDFLGLATNLCRVSCCLIS